MSVELIVWQRTGKDSVRKISVKNDVDGEELTHQAANRLARGMYSGMRTKVIDNHERDWSNVHSACDVMQEWMSNG